MALTLLKRSDADVVLATATDDPASLAVCLSAGQPFRVTVFATFPALDYALPSVQHALRSLHLSNGWFAASAREVAIAICDATVAHERHVNHCTDRAEPPTDAPTDAPLQAPAAADLGDEAAGYDADLVADDAVSATSADSFDPVWHELLQPCPREQADKATVIRRTLKERLGKWQADILLANYREAVLRVAAGQANQRFIVDCRGTTMRLALEAGHGRAVVA